jgi:hypothetical protein
MLAVVVSAGSLLFGMAFAGPVQAGTQLSLLCVPEIGETMVNGTCVLPNASQGTFYQAVIEASNGSVDSFTLTNGSLPTGLSMPLRFNVVGTIVAGTPVEPGNYVFTVQVVAPDGSSAQATYSIAVGPPLPLAVVLPAGGSTLHAGQVGVAYAQGFFSTGGVEPYTWSVVSGQLPPGLGLTSPYAPSDNNSVLSGSPKKAGKYTFTMQVTDGLGNRATQQFRLTIQK